MKGNNISSIFNIRNFPTNRHLQLIVFVGSSDNTANLGANLHVDERQGNNSNSYRQYNNEIDCLAVDATLNEQRFGGVGDYFRREKGHV
ncbi:hypothetical protein FACS1894176_10230 [Bacteroidia bacterium]|nr:hypothetical protein FACS1894176_10230 [Bacteroidia bacterium]